MAADPKYWFPSKRYGWGWGPPQRWQGWLVLVVYTVAVVAGIWIFPPPTMMPAYLTFMVGVSVLLVGVCWFKGEPPRWRWGK